MKKCKNCGIDFESIKGRKGHKRYCSDKCYKEMRKKQCPHYKDYWKTRRSWHRQHSLNSHGHHKVTKRPFPTNCEICNKVLIIPYSYHHWDIIEPKEKITKGIWICKKCHDIIGCYENPEYCGRYAKYLLLKKEIDEQYDTKTFK